MKPIGMSAAFAVFLMGSWGGSVAARAQFTPNPRLAQAPGSFEPWPATEIQTVDVAADTLTSPAADPRSGAWTPLVHPAPGAVNVMLLLSDGTVMAANNDDFTFIGNAWFRLTPDINGSYVNGTWSTRASMNDTRLFYSSDVLQDGRVFVAGGEYGTGGAKAEVYDPVSNTWTPAPVPTSLLNPAQASPLNGQPQSFLDSCSAILANGNILVTPVLYKTARETMIYNPISNIWTAGPNIFRGVYQDEASWVKLPDQSILTVDPFGTNSERYIPASNAWVNDGNLPVTLYDSITFEMGAGLLLPNGKSFSLGATGHTAIYTPTGTTSPGAWSAGADIPSSLATPDAPAAMMVNGKILCAVSQKTFNNGTNIVFPAPTSFYEYDYVANSFAQVNGPTGLTDNIAAFQATMLVLPDGNVLYAHFGSDLYVYQPNGAPLASGKPVVDTVSPNGDGSYHLTGTGLNGISEGAAYGDDAQMSSNYPLVRITNNIGNVYYARTFDWSSTGVMTGSLVTSTEFVLPAGLSGPPYSLVVVANGISSDPFALPAACCVPGNPCQDATQADCLALGGSYLGEGTFCAASGCVLHGDVNCDGSVNFGDINPFVLYLSNFSSWQATFPGCPSQNGDINGDGTFPSFGDINPFVTLLSGG